MKYCLWLIVAVACFHSLSAQDAATESLPETSLQSINEGSTTPYSLFAVRNIVITGNRKTKNSIILREIPFKTGEQYLLQDLVKKFEDARRQLLNTSLFYEVVVALKSFEGYDVDILIDVKERWYVFPVPYLRPVDRNINQWIVEQKASLSRVNYGIKLLYNNITGRNDKFRLWFVNGYTKQFSFSYNGLYIDKKLKWGTNMGFSMGKNREVNYNTINNKQAFIKDKDNYIRNFLNANAEITYRRATKTQHRFGIGYTKEIVNDTIVALNPTYFKSGHKSIRFPEIYYDMTYYDLDYNPYPTKGYAAAVSVGKRGFNNIINLWQLTVKGSGSWHVAPKSFINLNAFGVIKLPFKQPYFNQRMLGYSDVFIQGYEYYVIDGVAGGYLKATLTHEFLNFKVRVPIKKGKVPTLIPVRIFGKIYGNAGYVYNPQPGDNFLSNKMLYSGGAGIDILTFYDFTMKIEWTFNQLGQNGLFLHRKSIF
ncbi:MAG: POTRA domain-containing protein [Bacteroidota bacterium]